MKSVYLSHKSVHIMVLTGLLLSAGASAPATPALVAVQPAQPPADYHASPAPAQAYLQPVQVSPLTGTRAPTDNTFQDYGQNPFEDPLSTFCLDVDTDAYTVARRYVNDSLIPP